MNIHDRIAGRLVICSISGGKDSAAMSLYLRELGIDHVRVWANTGWENPRTLEYIRGPLTEKLGPIAEVSSTFGGMREMVLHKGMFPSRKFQFCTTLLKTAPMAKYMSELAEREERDILNVVGIRAAESVRRSTYHEWEDFVVHLKPSEGGPLDFQCEVWRPILRWSVEDVIAIHKRHGLVPNPLYLMGASRVGCWPCINAKKSEIRMIADTDPKRVDEIRALEAEVLAKAVSRNAANGTSLEERGHMHPTFFQAAVPDENGKRGMWPIDRAVEWSRTTRGGREEDRSQELFAHHNDGCARWGMCETGTEGDG